MMKADTISLDELRTLAHMSKRRVAYLLNNGFIPCEIREKATHRYVIQRADALEFLSDYKEHPEKYTVEGNQFTSVKETLRTPPHTVDPKVLRTYLINQWKDTPELLTAEDAERLTGYNANTVRRWMKEGRLRSAWLYEKRFTTTAWLIDFITEGHGATIVGKTAEHKELLKMK